MDKLNQQQIAQWFEQASPDEVVSVVHKGLERVSTFDQPTQDRFRSGIPASANKLLRQTA